MVSQVWILLLTLNATGNATAYKYIFDKCARQTLWQQFGEGAFLFQYDCSLDDKAKFTDKPVFEIEGDFLIFFKHILFFYSMTLSP